MPKLPTYDSQRNITSQLAAPVRNEAKEQAEVGAPLIEAAAEIQQKWNVALDTIQYTSAQASHNTAIADIKSRAVLDPDYNNYPKYAKELEDAKKNSLKDFQNKQVEQKAALDFGYDNKIADIEIANIFRKKQIDFGQVELTRGLDALVQRKISTISPEESMKVEADTVNLIKANVDAGIISREDGEKLLNNTRETEVKYDIYNDTARDEKDSMVLAELKKGENGMYSFLPSSSRLKLIEESQRRIFQNNQTFKREVETSQEVRNNNLIDKIASGDVTFKDIDAEFAIPEDAGGMKRKVLLTYQKALQSGIDKDLNQMLREKTPDKEPTVRAKMVKQYLDLVDNFIDDTGDKWKAKEMLADAYADGIISPKEQQFLNGLKTNLKDIEFNKSTAPVVSAIKAVKNFLKMQSNPDNETLAFRIKQLVGGIASGETPENMTRQVLGQEIISRIPDLENYPKEGKVKSDGKGNYIRIFPDGTYIKVNLKGNAQEGK